MTKVIDMVALETMASYVQKETNDLRDVCGKVKGLVEAGGRDFEAIQEMISYFESRQEVIQLARNKIQEILVQQLLGGDVQNITIN